MNRFYLKYCPIPDGSRSLKSDEGSFQKCLGDRCQWWDKDDCAVKGAVYMLKQIWMMLSKIEEVGHEEPN